MIRRNQPESAVGLAVLLNFTNDVEGHPGIIFIKFVFFCSSDVWIKSWNYGVNNNISII
jgi:hypothetical protein